jgi:hypothetical protein
LDMRRLPVAARVGLSTSRGPACWSVRASFVASDRTYGARRVWHDVLADGTAAGCTRSSG